jgi:hypothetical protein
MAKFTRPFLARGVKLAVDHIFDPLSAIGTALTNTEIVEDNLEQGRGPVRVNLWFPKISGMDLYEHAGAQKTDDELRVRHIAVPFVLPPLANIFDNTGNVPDEFKPLMLDEVSVSFDQGGLGASLLETPLLGDTGAITYESAAFLDIKITLQQKRMLAFGNTKFDPEQEVFSGEILASEILNEIARANPKVWTGLSQQVDPYKSFLMHIEAPGLAPDANGSFGLGAGDARFLCLPSFCVSLKFLSRLEARDVDETLQNAPTLAYESEAVTVDPATSNSLIAASGSKGIDTNMALLDGKLLSRLRGGLRPDGGRPGREHRKADACYDVIAVPMWHNMANDGYAAAINAGKMPWVGAAPYANRTTDEAWIPITAPFVVHHVFAANSICLPEGRTGNPAGKGRLPTSATLNTDIGVGIFSGVRGDDQVVDQVAYAGFTVAQRSSFVVDQLRVRREQDMSQQPTEANAFTHELLQIPVVGAGRPGLFTEAGTAIDQGQPVFIARGGLRALTRTNIDGGAPNCAGSEQFLVVRWSFHDGGGLSYATIPGPSPPGAAASPLEVYSGTGGSWVFIIGRKHIQGTLDNRRM